MIDSEKKNTSHIVKINPLFLGFVGIMVLVVLGLLFANKTQLLSKKLNSSTYDPAQSFNPDPSASAGSLSTKQIADSDPIVSCGPGVHSGQYISDRQSNCKNYVDCGLYDEKGNTTWTLMLNDVCNKKHNEKNANSDNGSSTNDSIAFQCATSTGIYTQHGRTYEEACRAVQDYDRRSSELTQKQDKINNDFINGFYAKPYINDFVQPTFSPIPYTNLGGNPSPAPCTPILPGRGGFADNPC